MLLQSIPASNANYARKLCYLSVPPSSRLIFYDKQDI